MSIIEARNGIEQLQSALKLAGVQLNSTIARGWIKQDLRQATLKDLRACYEHLNRALTRIGKVDVNASSQENNF